ncbi:MAG: helix-turn-helix domain-containing protein [Actinobacteria bacterium]|nr:helix-turn-helix domain-containing protein [Actinomycetota bacterium]
MMTITSEYLGIAEVAILFGTSPSALYSQRHRGEAPGSLCVKVGKKLMWKKAELEAWFDQQRQNSESR